MDIASLSICVFCGSSNGNNPAHEKLAQALGQKIAARGDRLVYGGGGLGLMGALARAAHDNGAEILGIMPEFLSEIEKTFTQVTHEIVPDMHQRKARMYAESDAFIILPGGIGTLEEAIEILSWQRLNLHNKPIIFLSDTGYWDALLNFISQMIVAGFAPKTLQSALHQAQNIDHAFEMIAQAIETTPPPHNLHKDILGKV